MKTLKGRKRFLSKIKFGNVKEKLKAERQAVNSVCQVKSYMVLLLWKRVTLYGSFALVRGYGYK